MPLLPASLTRIYSQAFYCTALTGDLYLGTNGAAVTFYEGSHFDNTKFRSITLGDGVTALPWDCFRFNNRLGRVKMSDAVTSISSEVFRECTALTNVVPLMKHEWYATRLVSLTLDSVPAYGSESFRNCTAVREVWINGDVPTSFGSNAFQGWGVGQSRLHLPNDSAAWRAWAAANGTPWQNLTTAQRETYWNRWGDGRRPIGRTASGFVANQWAIGWTPPGNGTMVILR